MRLRLGLRTFLLLILVTGTVAGLFARKKLIQRREDAAVRALSARENYQIRYGEDASENAEGPATQAYLYSGNSTNKTSAVTRADVEALGDLRELRVLHFGMSLLDADAVPGLGQLSKLEELHLSHFPVDDSMAKSISRLHRLKKLHIDNAYLTLEGILAIAKMGQLEDLDIQRMNQPTDLIEGAGAELAKLTSLRSLSLKAQLSNDDIRQLSKLTQLETLNLYIPGLTAPGLESLENLRKLSYLSIYGPSLGNDALDSIAKIESLRQLDCGLGRVDDTGIAKLQTLDNLARLTVIHTACTKEAIASLEGMKSLEQIMLGHPQMPGGKLMPGKKTNWPKGTQGSGVFSRQDDGSFREMTNQEVLTRGYW